MQKIRKLDVGKGQPLILLNGMFQSVESWDAVAQPLARFYRVIAFDMPNQGVTNTTTEYNSLSCYAEFVLDIMDELEIKPSDAIIFGYSFGAGVARSLAFDKKIKLRGLILGGSLPRDISKYLLRRMSNWLDLIDKGSFELWAQTMLIDIFSPLWIANNTDSFDEIYKTFLINYSQRPLAARSLVAAVVNSLLVTTDAIEEFNFPVHVIAAEDDSIAPFKYVKRFSQAISARKLHVLPGGHTLRIEALPQLIHALDEATRDMSD